MFTVKNRINPGAFPRLIITIFIFSALIIGLRAERVPQSGNDKVKILILSKHLRLLKEGKSGQLQITMPESGEIDTGSRRIPCKKLSIIYQNSSFLISTDKNIIPGETFTLYPKDRNDAFSIEINGERRLYPLPLYIRKNNNDLELSIEETVDRFAADSAWGELGNVPGKNMETLYALSHLIKARCSLPYLTNKHNGYHFCDLTCCQTYKGKSGFILDDPVSINTAGIKNGIFFHSSSGGTLFTESVFNGKGRTAAPPKDLIYSENFTLSRVRYLSWSAEIDEHKLAGILFPGKNVFLKNFTFDRDKEIITLETGTGNVNLSPESFRLAINRIKGWNFLKSNNYSFTRRNGIYKFTGSGLGHGAGMSFEGAMQLAERGYSRYEILEHYYPDLKYNTSASDINHQLQYVIFDSETGAVIKSSSGVSFNSRIIPCGSLFKLFISLYLAEKRTDLFHNYFYTCTNSEKDRLMPRQCWNKPGHGRMNISSALYNSCNKYFASLYSRIDQDDFIKWITEFTTKQGIELIIPEITDRNGFSTLLAGLNFNATITIDGIIKLNRCIYIENRNRSSEEIEIIFNALHKTFTEGTAKKTFDENNPENIFSSDRMNQNRLWGKTGTVIAGTNSHYGYGLFTGGTASTGIVALLRKGTGAIAAKESAKILLKSQ
jgi:hypothetical protein